MSESTASLRVFVQVQGQKKAQIIKVLNDSDIAGLVRAAQERGIHVAEDVLVTLEDQDGPISHDTCLSDAGVKNNTSVHLGDCKRVDVLARYDGSTERQGFSPAQRLRHVFKWAVGKRGFEIPEGDAQDLVLILAGGQQPLDLDDHVGLFVNGSNCEARFDLVPRDRIQG